jgi:predicted DsbA family dithiol-disulfide isomerase
VTAEEAQVRQNGVTGVPAFLINKRLFVIGAQPTESLVNIFDRAMFGEESDLEVSTTVH